MIVLFSEISVRKSNRNIKSNKTWINYCKSWIYFNQNQESSYKSAYNKSLDDLKKNLLELNNIMLKKKFSMNELTLNLYTNVFSVFLNLN